MKITAFAASTSSKSINKELVKFVSDYFPNDEVNLLDLNNYEMPIYSSDRELEGFPKPAYSFLEAIAESDALICSLAEHNRTFTAAFKNIFDWSSRVNVKVFQNKKMLLLSTSPGGFGGGNVMNVAKTFFPQFGAEIIASYSLPKFYENFEIGKGVINVSLLEELESKIDIFKKSI